MSRIQRIFRFLRILFKQRLDHICRRRSIYRHFVLNYWGSQISGNFLVKAMNLETQLGNIINLETRLFTVLRQRLTQFNSSPKLEKCVNLWRVNLQRVNLWRANFELQEYQSYSENDFDQKQEIFTKLTKKILNFEKEFLENVNLRRKTVFGKTFLLGNIIFSFET